MEPVFRIAFWLIFAGMVVMQATFALEVRRAKPGLAPRKPPDREGTGCAFLRAIRSLALVVFLVLYAWAPVRVRVLSLLLPGWLRWVGVALGVISLALYAWSRATLGRAWSSPLQTHEEQHLVTTGPYARIRHPIYLALLGFLTGIALIAANGFLIVVLAFSIMDLSLRMRAEEQMMIDEFGEDYRAYMQKTGRLLPR